MYAKNKMSIPNFRKLDIKFCTECDDKLDNFSLNPMSVNIKAVKDNHENCKKTGKFKGELCSRLFISSTKFDKLDEEE
jgi:hypothetical protein